MNAIPYKAVAVAGFLVLAFVVVLLLLRTNDQARELQALRKEIDKPAATEASRSVAVAAPVPPSQVGAQYPPAVNVAPAANAGEVPQSVVEGQDTELIRAGRRLLGLPEGAGRTLEWAKLLEKANFFELARFTEIVAQPPAPKKLDADHLAMRVAALKKMASNGQIRDYVLKRQAFDWPGDSGMLELAYREMARADAKGALKLWMEREQKLSGGVPAEKVLKGLVLGLSAAEDKQAAADAISTLPDALKQLLTERLASGG